MANRSSVCWYASRKAYYSWIDGVQNFLGVGPDDRPAGPNYRQACEKLHRLLTGQAVHQAGDANPVGLVLAKYLQHLEAHRRPSTVRIRKAAYRPFAARHGEMAVGDLRHSHLYEFIDAMKTVGSKPDLPGAVRWGDGATRIFLASMQAAFNWAARP